MRYNEEVPLSISKRNMSMIFKELGDNLAILVVLCVISGFIRQHWSDNRRVSFLPGLLFGSVAIIGMIYPTVLKPGLIFDGRSVIISLCGLFFGPVAVSIAAAMTIVYRMFQGGIGTDMGVLVILSSAILGVVFHYRWIRKGIEVSFWQYLGFGLIVHISMLLSTSALPLSITWDVLNRISLPVMLFYPTATIIIGKLLSEQSLRHRHLEELRENEERIRGVIDNTQAGYFFLDREGIFKHVNNAWLHMHGYESTDEIIGKHCLITQLDSDTEANRNKVERLLAGESVPSEQVRCLRKDGSIGYFTISAHPVKQMGEIVGLEGFIIDITDRELADQEKRQFYRDTIKSVTQGKLDLVSYEDVKKYLHPSGLISNVDSPADTANARHSIMRFCALAGFCSEIARVFETAVGEALTNAIKHANGCRVYAGVCCNSIWVAVSDTGPGISSMTLPHATLRRGYSSKTSMGMGYSIMMEATDNILLCTGCEGTIIVLSVNAVVPKHDMSLDDFPDNWNEIPASGW